MTVADDAEQAQKTYPHGAGTRPTVKNVLLIHAPLAVRLLHATYGGRVHEQRMAEATPSPLPVGSGLLQDLGFLAFTLPQVEMLMPTTQPQG